MPRKTIVLSDSADITNAVEASFFSRDGFVLLRAAGGEEVFALAEENDPALFVLDLARPGMDGCLQRLRVDPLLRRAAVLAIAPSGDPPPGASAVLLRPFSRQSLLDHACRLLGIVTRAAPRLPADLPVRYGAPGGELRSGRTFDINAGGIFLCGDLLLPSDTEIRFVVTLSPGTEMAGAGRVSWVNHPEWVKKKGMPKGMGVQFLSLDDDRLLRRWLCAAAGGAGKEAEE